MSEAALNRANWLVRIGHRLTEHRGLDDSLARPIT
jgi:hypothetical protein